MPFFRWLQKLSGFHADRPVGAPESRPVDAGRDSLSVVRELTRLFLPDDTDASGPSLSADTADISLVLGNLFRAQGDIDRAVALREAILARPDLERGPRARTFFELGRDYRTAGFLDRALDAYREARKLGFPEREVRLELARLYSDSGDFASAASEYAHLDMPYAEACFLVRQAAEMAGNSKDDAASRLLRQALSVFPGSPEAWLALTSMSLMGGDAQQSLAQLGKGLARCGDAGRLILLEGLYCFARGPDINPHCLEECAVGLGRILGNLEQSLTLCYYAGLFLHLAGHAGEAEQWFTKCLVLDPDFWAARLALLSLTAGREELPPLLAQQVAFFTEQGARSKRFLCPPCGLRRDTVFSQCPRCQAWHSAAFRMRLT